MENYGAFDGAVRIKEEPSEVSLIDDDQNVIDKSPDTNNSQLSQVRQDNNSTFRPWETRIDVTGTSLAVIEDDSPNDSRERDFSEDRSTRNIINAETKDVKEKVTGGVANELEAQIDSESVKGNEIGTNIVIVFDNLPGTFILPPCTQGENPQNLQSSVQRRHSDSDVPTSNWPPWDPRPSTSSFNSMPRHNSLESVTTTNSNKPCICPDSRRGNMTTHRRLHRQGAQDKPYPCNLCDRSFTHKHNRKRHMLTHSGDRPYPCNLCDQSFTHKHNRKRHMLTHNGEKSHKCPECGQRFSRLDAMTAHRRIHTGEKPFKCPECEYEAIRKDMISKHMKTHSRDRVSGSSSRASPAEPARQELPEAPRPARFESSSSGYETIRLPNHIAPQVDQDEMSPPDHDDKTIAPRYHPYL